MALGRAALEDALPRSAHKPLGLPLIGNAVGRDWTDAEAHQFEEGMLEHGRDFPAIRKEFLPQRETEHLVLYYYNVWKTQSTARAQAWYRRLEEVSPFLVSACYISGHWPLYLPNVNLKMNSVMPRIVLQQELGKRA